MENVERDAVISLIRAARAGDDSAFEELVNMYRPLIDSSSRKYSRDPDDFLSEVLLGFYRAVSTYSFDCPEVTFGLYAKICIDRCMIDALRRNGKNDGIKIDRSVDVDTIAVSGGIQAMLEYREQMSNFLKVAEGVLSDLEYKVYRLWMLGYKTREIAAALGVSARSVDNAKNRGLTKLKSALLP